MRDTSTKRSIVAFVFVLIFIISLSKALLTVLNQYVDSTAPSVETMVVTDIGKYYQPFRVDYLSRYSRVLERAVRVPVLFEVAAKTAIGDSTQIVVGSGLFQKPWVETKNEHQKYGENNFSTLYVAIFVLFFMGGSFVVLKVCRAFWKGQDRTVQVFFAAIAVGILLFYFF